MSGTGQEQGTDEDRLDVALGEYMQRVDRGEPVDRAAFLAEHLDVADELRPCLETADAVERMAGPPLGERPQATMSGQATQSAVTWETVSPSLAPGAAAPPDIGPFSQVFGRYRIARRLGQGAMGSVYLAQDTQLQRNVALKVPRMSDDEPEVRERFYREARAAATLHHRNICPVFDLGESDGVLYLSMAYIEGKPLSDLIHSGPPPSSRAVALTVRKLALALHEAHAKGIVHRDLKPANIMIDRKREPVIMDFGLAHLAGPESVRLTQSGAILGSPAYMSPEQVEGDTHAVGPATDIYSLGVLLYEMLTRTLPFGGTVSAVLCQILSKEPRKPSDLRPDIDPALEAICLRMMAKKRDDRYADMRQVADALTAYLKAQSAATETMGAVATLAAPRPEAAAVPSGTADSAAGDPRTADPVPPLVGARGVGEPGHAEARQRRTSAIPWLMGGTLAVASLIVVSLVTRHFRGGDEIARIDSGGAVNARPLPIEDGPNVLTSGVLDGPVAAPRPAVVRTPGPNIETDEDDVPVAAPRPVVARTADLAIAVDEIDAPVAAPRPVLVEIGTEGDLAGWENSPEDRSAATVAFAEDRQRHIVGGSSVRAVIDGYDGKRLTLHYPKSSDAGLSLEGKSRLAFWVRAERNGVPLADLELQIVGLFEHRKSADDRVWWFHPSFQTLAPLEQRQGWSRVVIPLAESSRFWNCPKFRYVTLSQVNKISLLFAAPGIEPLTIWIDGMELNDGPPQP